MKVAITGHTRGLGKELFNLYENAIGFSRSNGFDINDPDPIVKAALDCDVFINNAWDKFAQVGILESLFYFWRYENKTIVNISSVSPENTRRFDAVGLYATHKLALDDASATLNNVRKNCRIVNIKLDWLDTEMSQYWNVPKMDPGMAALEIKKIIDTSDITKKSLCLQKSQNNEK